METVDPEELPETLAVSRHSVWSIGITSVGLARAEPEVSDRDGDERFSSNRAARMILPDSVLNTEGGPLTLATFPTLAAPTTLTGLERACLAARVSLEHKGRDIIVLDMRDITRLYDYFVIGCGNSRRQIHTMAEEIDRQLADIGDRRLSIEGYEASKWVVQDYGDVVVHLFDPATRQYYGLEDLWADAPRIDWMRE